MIAPRTMGQPAILTAIERHLDNLQSFAIKEGTVLVSRHDFDDALANLDAVKLDYQSTLEKAGAPGEFIITHAGWWWKVKMDESIEPGTFKVGTAHDPRKSAI